MEFTSIVNALSGKLGNYDLFNLSKTIFLLGTHLLRVLSYGVISCSCCVAVILKRENVKFLLLEVYLAVMAPIMLS